MDFTKIKTGDILKIKEKEYEITESWDKGFDKLSSGKEKWFSLFEMVEIGSGKITSTHSIIHYDDGKKIFLIDKINKKKKKIKKEEVKLFSS